jgi:2'-5' RNA ligase
VGERFAAGAGTIPSSRRIVAVAVATGGQTIPTLPIHRKLTEGINYFFAVLPDDEARAGIACAAERFLKAHRISGSPVAAERFHLTLAPMGKPERLRQPMEAALLAAGAGVRAAGFDVSLDSAMRFSARDSRFPFVLCADANTTDAALKVRKAIAVEQLRSGLRMPGVSSFLPHVTLLYGHAVDAIQESIPPVRWTVSDFVLIRSFFGQSTHEVIGRWRLDAPTKPEVPDYLEEMEELQRLSDLPIDE